MVKFLKPDKTSSQNLANGALSYTTDYTKPFKLHEILIRASVAITEDITITLDAAADAQFGATACYFVRDAAEAVIIDVAAGEKVNLDGTATSASEGITATGAGEKVCVVATTDSDASGTDGWIAWGNTSGWGEETP